MDHAAPPAVQTPDLVWPVDAIREASSPVLPGLAVEVLGQIDSSNTELMRRARAGRLEPVLLVAQQQTAGRGRLGRQWISGTPSASLMFSLGLVLEPSDWSGLSLAVGLSLARSLHPQLQLKWPNDLWWQDRKLGGILIETANGPGPAGARYCVVGVGLNLEPREAAGLATPPAWLAEVLPGVDAAQALMRVAIPLIHTIKAFEHQGFAPLQREFNLRDALANRPVILSDGTSGVARGVDGSGALRVYSALGVQTITSAEVSVRPLPHP